MLSCIAGFVNITGVLSVKTLTTNVTGHFAYFSEELINHRYVNAAVFFLYIISFLLGAFTSNLLIEIMLRKKPSISHVLPMTVEIFLLALTGMEGDNMAPHWVAFILLFAMGIQNSLVTKVSLSVVRTTHLTGIFTDLGMELSQLFFYRRHPEFKRLLLSIRLRLSIIIFFFTGCLSGGYLWQLSGIRILLGAAVCLTALLLYDTARFRYYHLKRRIRLAFQVRK